MWTNLIDNAVDALGAGGRHHAPHAPPRRARVRGDRRRRAGHPRRPPGPHLRRLLHHQAGGPGHRPRARHRPAHRGPPPRRAAAALACPATPASRCCCRSAERAQPGSGSAGAWRRSRPAAAYAWASSSVSASRRAAVSDSSCCAVLGQERHRLLLGLVDDAAHLGVDELLRLGRGVGRPRGAPCARLRRGSRRPGRPRRSCPSGPPSGGRSRSAARCRTRRRSSRRRRRAARRRVRRGPPGSCASSSSRV